MVVYTITCLVTFANKQLVRKWPKQTHIHVYVLMVYLSLVFKNTKIPRVEKNSGIHTMNLLTSYSYLLLTVTPKHKQKKRQQRKV